MKNKSLSLILTLSTLIVFASVNRTEARLRKTMKVTALSFLKVGVGARANAMGNAAGAAVNDASAIYWNPAALSNIHRSEFFLMHNESILDTRMEYGAIVYPFSAKHTFGVGVTLLGIDNIPITTLDQPRGTGDMTRSRDLAITLSYGTTFKPLGVSLGLSLKYFREDLYDVSAGGVLVDVALNLPRYIKNLDISLIGQNLGSTPATFDEDKFDAPNNFKLGLAYRIPHPLIEDRLLLTYDFNTVDQATSNFGVELNFRHRYFLRGGWDQAVDEGTGLTFGAGVNIKDFKFDYAYVPMGKLGKTHRVSLGYVWGKSREKEEEFFKEDF